MSGTLKVPTILGIHKLSIIHYQLSIVNYQLIIKLEIKEIFERFERLRVLIVGDVMIDRYLVGAVERISPEAPVPVVHLQRTDNRLGGAANVALNIKALGAMPYLCSVVGDDAEGVQLRELLRQEGLTDMGIFSDASRPTTVKTRVLAKSQQLLRFDSEVTTDLSADVERLFFEKIKTLIEQEKIDVLLFQDYNKGVLTANLIQQLSQHCHEKGVLTTADPKKANFFAYKNVTLFKPNLKEVSEAVGFALNPDDLMSLRRAAAQVRQKLDNVFTLITLSEKGMFLDDGKTGLLVPTQPRNIADVCGAGDTVISVASLGLAAGLEMETVVRLANMAGGIVCERVGVVPIDRQQLAAEFS